MPTATKGQLMSDSNRTVTASTKVTQETADFLDTRAENGETTRAEILRRLVHHYQTATENGLSCPHCKNEIQLDL